MYRAFRIQLPLADTNYNLFERLSAESGLPADAVLVDRAQHLILAAEPGAAAVVYVGDYRLAAAEYGWVVSIATYPLHLGPARGNSICIRDLYLRTDIANAFVLVNVQST